MGRFIDGIIPERFVEVDAARLLLILARFATTIDDNVRILRCFPGYPVVRHFTPEYHLQKLDFLVRYPGYLAYELVELHRTGDHEANDRAEVISIVRGVLENREPDLLTMPFRKFWRGAYERLDDVEAWWYSRDLIYAQLEARGQARPQKHYFVTEQAIAEAQRLVACVSHARWYAERIELIHRFLGGLAAGELKALQYSHPEYREAHLNETIPDVDVTELARNFECVFGEPLGVSVD